MRTNRQQANPRQLNDRLLPRSRGSLGIVDVAFHLGVDARPAAGCEPKIAGVEGDLDDQPAPDGPLAEVPWDRHHPRHERRDVRLQMAGIDKASAIGTAHQEGKIEEAIATDVAPSLGARFLPAFLPDSHQRPEERPTPSSGQCNINDLGKVWRSLRDSNPCTQRERLVS